MVQTEYALPDAAVIEATKVRILEIAKQNLLASEEISAETPDLQQRAQVYVEAIAVTDETIGDLESIQAELVLDIERENLLVHHPAHYESTIDMLDAVLRNSPSPKRATKLSYVRDQVLPRARDVLENMEKLPGTSNLEEIAHQATEAITRGDDARVCELVQMAGDLSLRDLREELRPQEAADYIQERIGPNQVCVTMVISNRQLRLIQKLGWLHATIRS